MTTLDCLWVVLAFFLWLLSIWHVLRVWTFRDRHWQKGDVEFVVLLAPLLAFATLAVPVAMCARAAWSAVRRGPRRRPGARP